VFVATLTDSMPDVPAALHAGFSDHLIM